MRTDVYPLAHLTLYQLTAKIVRVRDSMKMKIAIYMILLSAVFAGRARAQIEWSQFGGMCDASAMEMLSDDLFVVGNDEDNVLRVYSRKQQGFPIQSLDFSSLVRAKKKKTPEMDLEAAAR